jgi:hypothetical protein
VNLAAVRAGLAANLGALSNLQTSAYMLAEPTPATAHVVVGDVAYDRAMGRGLDEQTMKVQVFVGLVSDRASQVNLDTYLAGSGSGSVKQALESDPTLGGAAQDVTVKSATGPQILLRPDGTSLLMAEWTIQVLAHG